MILAKRLTLDGHIVVNTTNGQEGVDMVKSDRNFDIILMDVQYVQPPLSSPKIVLITSYYAGCQS